jgi:glycosyltransferase involved in cell wall biosynthesis
MNEIEVLHLRQAAGGGGGADIALFDTLRLFNKNFFHCSVAYMVKQFNEVAPLARAFKEEGLELTQYTGSAWFDPFQLRSLHVFIRRRKVTILHCHDSKSRVFGCLLKLLNPHLQLIATLHGWIPHRMRSRIYIALDKLSLRFFKVNIAVSDEIQQKAVQAGAKKTLLIRNGVDTSLWRPAPKQFAIHQNRIVGFVGRLSKEKGIHEFIQIAAQISKQISNCIFWIVGEGPEKENIHKLVYDLGMERRIYQLGLKNRN